VKTRWRSVEAVSFTSVGMADTLACAIVSMITLQRKLRPISPSSSIAVARKAAQPSSAASACIGAVDHCSLDWPLPSQLPVSRALRGSIWRRPVRYSKWTGISGMKVLVGYTRAQSVVFMLEAAAAGLSGP
jgi:hypothetical protein